MLTDPKVRNAQPTGKAYKLADGKGLYLLVTPTGARCWRMNYRFNGKQKTVTFGIYPAMTIKEARQRRDEARALLAEGLDPMAERKAERESIEKDTQNTFAAIAREWLDKMQPSWSAITYDHAQQRLTHDLFPHIGHKPIDKITAPELLAALRAIVDRGRLHTAGRARADASRVFRYAIATGRAERDPSADLRGALPAGKTEHRSTIVEPAAVGELLRAIDGYLGEPTVRAALKLAPLVFLRPGELAAAEWSEFDLDAGEWRIPGARMKMKGRHIVPLSAQAVAILRDLRPLTEYQAYVFPHARNRGQHMSRESVRAALVRMGYGPSSETPMTAHGFRAMASTLLHEQGWPSDMIERQLAHAERNKIKAAYNHAEHLPERRRMMQAWADYLDSLKQGAAIIPFRKSS